GMLALTVHLVAPHDGAFNGGRGELDTLALGSEVGGGNAEFHAVEPEVAVLAVGLLCPKANGNRGAAVLRGGNEDLVVIDLRSSGIRRHSYANIINAQR